MIAAGVQNTGPLGTHHRGRAQGVPGQLQGVRLARRQRVHHRSAWIQALTDAVNDGMDIVTLSLGEGDPAFFGPLDKGTNVCGDAICDVGAQAVENASQSGHAGGGGGRQRRRYRAERRHAGTRSIRRARRPARSRWARRRTAIWSIRRVRVNGQWQPGKSARADFGDGPKISSPLTAPVKDVTTLGNNGLACAALPAGSLTGAWALIQRGTCYLQRQGQFRAGRRRDRRDHLSVGRHRRFHCSACMCRTPGIPAVMIGNSDGKALKSLPGHNLKCDRHARSGVRHGGQSRRSIRWRRSPGADPAWAISPPRAISRSSPNSWRPAPTSTPPRRSYDPNSDTYNATGYTTVNGTSYAVPFVAGVAAMAKAQELRT